MTVNRAHYERPFEPTGRMVQCQRCDKTFEAPSKFGAAPKFCSYDCLAATNRDHGRVHRGTCLICKESFLGKKNSRSGLPPSYCSIVCAREGMRQQGYAKTFEKKCEECGKAFFTDKWKLKTKRFCSQLCAGRSHMDKGTIFVNCTTCGTEIRRTPKDQKWSRHYCNWDCMALGKVIEKPRSNTPSGVRKWFGRYERMIKCVRCGYNEETRILIVHHKDRDRQNNDLSNLEVLCPNCHALEHMAENKNGWKDHKSTRKRRSWRVETPTPNPN